MYEYIASQIFSAAIGLLAVLAVVVFLHTMKGENEN